MRQGGAAAGMSLREYEKKRRFNVTPELSFDFGTRTVWMERSRVDGYRATYNAVPWAFGAVRWEFKQ